MKDNELQQLKPVYIHEAFATHDDEINLVDLALVLVRRKTIIMTILGLFIAAGIAYALATETKSIYTYHSSIEIGTQLMNGNRQPIESPSSLQAKVIYGFIPKTLHQYQQQNPEDEKVYEITASNPKDSSVITLSMSATEDKSELAHGFINRITQDILQEHEALFNTIKETLELQLTQATNRLNSMGNMDSRSEKLMEKTSLQDKIDSYLSQLANLRGSKVISEPMKSQKPSNTSNNKLIVVIATFAGLFIGIFSAFFVEFAVKVQEKKAELNLS